MENLNDDGSNDYNEESNLVEAHAVKKYNGPKSFQKRNFRLPKELSKQGESITNLVSADEVKGMRPTNETQSPFVNKILQVAYLNDLHDNKNGTNNHDLRATGHEPLFSTPSNTTNPSDVTRLVGDIRSAPRTNLKLFNMTQYNVKNNTMPILSTNTVTIQGGITLKVLADSKISATTTATTISSKDTTTIEKNNRIDNFPEALPNNSTKMIDFDKKINSNSSIKEGNETQKAVRIKAPKFKTKGTNKLSQKLAFGMLGNHRNKNIAQYLSPRKEIFTNAMKTTTSSTTIKTSSTHHQSSKKKPYNFKNGNAREQQIRHKTIFI